MSLAVDIDEHLIQMPAPPAGFHSRQAALPDLGGEHRAEPMPPVPGRLVAYIDAMLMQRFPDIPL